MSEFTPITTQEAFDDAIKERLRRQGDKHAAEVAELTEKLNAYEAEKGAIEADKNRIASLENELNEAKNKIAGFDSVIAEKDATIKKHETHALKTKICAEFNIPSGLVDRLTGETEEELRADAETLVGFIGKTPVAPMARQQSAHVNDTTTKAYKDMLKNLTHKE